MTENVQRNVEEIDAWTRAFAAANAQTAGVPTRDWLEQFIARQAAPSQPSPGLSPVFGRRAGPGYLVTARMSPEIRTGRLAPGVANTTDVVAEAVATASAETPEETTDSDVQATDPGVATADPEGLSCFVDVTRSLRELSEQTRAIEAELEADRQTPAVPATAALAPPQDWLKASTDALARLGGDVSRLVDVVDCGFELLDASGARQTLELREEITRGFAELRALIDRAEQSRSDTASLDSAQEARPDSPPQPIEDVNRSDASADPIDTLGAAEGPPAAMEEPDWMFGEPMAEPADVAVPALAQSEPPAGSPSAATEGKTFAEDLEWVEVAADEPTKDAAVDGVDAPLSAGSDDEEANAAPEPVQAATEPPEAADKPPVDDASEDDPWSFDLSSAVQAFAAYPPDEGMGVGGEAGASALAAEAPESAAPDTNEGAKVPPHAADGDSDLDAWGGPPIALEAEPAASDVPPPAETSGAPDATVDRTAATAPAKPAFKWFGFGRRAA